MEDEPEVRAALAVGVALEIGRCILTRVIRRSVCVACVFVSAVALHAQSRLPAITLEPDVRALVELRARIQRSLASIPDYTCSQTIRRTRLTAKARKRLQQRLRQARNEETRLELSSRSTDRLGLEVAVVGGQELYAWPGGAFQDRSVSEMVGFGTTSTGDFSSHLESIFVHGQARIDYVGIEPILGRAAFRFDYAVSAFRSGYWIGTTEGRATSAYRGSFWATEDEGELLRLTVEAVEIPPELGVESSLTAVDYQTVAVGERRFPLPATADVRMTFRNGSEEINQTEFHDCRRFGAESDLSFAAASQTPEQPAREAKEGPSVPAGIEMGLKLASRVDSRTTRTGDPVEATLTHDLRAGRELIARKGSRLTGRLRRLERMGEPGEVYFAVGLEFDRLHAGQSNSAVHMELVRLGNALETGDGVLVLNRPANSRVSRTGRQSILGLSESITIEQDEVGPLANIPTFFVHGDTVSLKPGLRMTWRTVAEHVADAGPR